MNTQTTPTILYLDASSLRLSACKRRLFFNNVLGLRAPRENIDMVFGKAFHTYAEWTDRTEGKDDLACINAAKLQFLDQTSNNRCDIPKRKAHLNLKYLMEVCMKYGYAYKTDNIKVLRAVETDKPLVECKFAIPIFKRDNVIIMLAGTIDKICLQFQDNWPFVLDYKTTSAWEQDTYLSQYSLDPQLMVYCWALRWMYRFGIANGEVDESGATNPFTFYINALKQQACFERGIYGGQIYGVFLSSQGTTTFKRSSMFVYNDEKLDEFELLVNQTATRLYEATLAGLNSPREGIVNAACTGGKRPCDFGRLCNAPDQQSVESLIDNSFIKVPYNPLRFGEDRKSVV